MKDANVCLIGLMFVVSVSAEPLLEGRVRLESGEPVADAQVRLFDMSDLRQGAIARAQTDGTGYFALPLAALGGRALPERFALGPNYPNPFNPSTIIPYQLASSSPVRLEVFNLLGQRIATLVDGERPAGFHTATWHAVDEAGRAVGAGMYIYRMTVGVESQTGRMVLVDGQAGVAAAGAASGMPGVSGGGGSDGEDAQEYGLIVSGEGLVPYVDSSFRVESGMTPVELVVSAGPHSVGKATDDGAFSDLFDALNDAQEEEEAGPSGKAQATLEAPPPPTNLRFEAVTDSSCRVRWDAAEGATDYDVNYKQAVGGTWTNVPHKGVRLYTTIYDLEPNTEYRWAARSENSDGPSEWVFGPNFTTLLEEEDTPEEEAEEEEEDAPEEGEEDDETPEEEGADGQELIPDANLRAAIAAALGKASGAPITQADMAMLDTLDGPHTAGRGISDLTGLEYAINLAWLYLSDNNLSDISPLAGLTRLDHLYLEQNKIVDISPLAGLTKLVHVDLRNNRIRDLAPLVGLTNLFFVEVNQNPLNAASIATYIPGLQGRGVRVDFDDKDVDVQDVDVQEEEEDEAPEEETEEGDLIVYASISKTSLMTGQAFTLRARVQNQGTDAAQELVLSYYRSSNATISTQDTLLGTDEVSSLAASRISRNESISLTAPSAPGTYYYGACVTSGSGESDTHCSTGVRVSVEGGGSPDLIVSHTEVSHSSVTLGGRFELRVKIENIGTGLAAETGMRYYRSDDATIDATDTKIWAFSTPRLNASESHSHSMRWPISDEGGTYYVGVCVNPVPGETNSDNNCSIGVRVIVEDRGSPDLIVSLPEIKERSRTSRGFDIKAAVVNIGSNGSAATTLQYYRSDDAIIDATDKRIWNTGVKRIAAEWYWEHYPRGLLAPESPGTYYYGACVRPVPGESDTDNNCSEAVPINVGVPDLAIGLAWASTSVPLAGQSFTLRATVRNQGPDQAASTTLRYYRSDDAIIDATDTAIGTDAVSSLAAFDSAIGVPGRPFAAYGSSREATSVNAPSSPGTYYYGACADPVPGEANTDNNCSTGVYVRVVPSGEDPFNIELVFLGDLSDEYKDLMQQAARRWETIITEGLPDVNFSANPYRHSLGDETIAVDDTVDDLRIFVHGDSSYIGAGGAIGHAAPLYIRSGNPIGLPAVGEVGINLSFFLHQRGDPLRLTMLHEIAHVLGFGTFIWSELGLVHGPSRNEYFRGELAIQAFNIAGGESYSGNKVPLDLRPDHWNPVAFGSSREFGIELMNQDVGHEAVLSAITIQSLADLGYVVDVSRADPFRLPASISTMQPFTASAKPVASQDFCLGARGPIYVGDERGNVIRTIGD